LQKIRVKEGHGRLLHAASNCALVDEEGKEGKIEFISFNTSFIHVLMK